MDSVCSRAEACLRREQADKERRGIYTHHSSSLNARARTFCSTSRTPAYTRQDQAAFPSSSSASSSHCTTSATQGNDSATASATYLPTAPLAPPRALNPIQQVRVRGGWMRGYVRVCVGGTATAADVCLLLRQAKHNLMN